MNNKNCTSLKQKIAYTLLFSGQNIIYAFVAGYLATYYIVGLKISPFDVALIIFITRIFDAINDPLLGILMDRFKISKDRYKPYLNISTFLLPIVTFCIFLGPVNAPYLIKIIYAIITYILWDILYTMSEVPAFAMSMAMAHNEKERNKLLALTQVGSLLGGILALVPIFLIISNGVENINWVLMGIVPAVLGFLMMIPQIFCLKERHGLQEHSKGIKVSELIKVILKNDQLLIIMFIYLSQMFINANAVYAIFVNEGFYGYTALGTIIGLIAMFGIIPLAMLSPKFVDIFGKKTLIFSGIISSLIGTVIILFAVYTYDTINLPLVILGNVLIMYGIIMPSILRGMFTSDAIEYGAYKTGVRNEATSFSVQTFFNKAGDALGATFGALILGFVGYNENLDVLNQANEVINNLWILTIVMPLLMMLTWFIGLKFFYKLDEGKIKKYASINKNKDVKIHDHLDAKGIIQTNE